MSAVPTIQRFPSTHEGAFVNAYLVETASGVVAVDGLLQLSAAKEMRAGLDGLGKPLLAALLTHSHPDHYAGLGEIVAGYDVPIYAPQGVIDTITADDALKDQSSARSSVKSGRRIASSRTPPSPTARASPSTT